MRAHGILGVAAVVVGAAWPLTAAAAEAADTTRVRELEQRLDQRDATIRDLLQRVERLERDQASRASAPMVTARSAPSAPAPASTPQVAQAAPSAAPAVPPKPGPGEFTISEEDAQRALERALVQTGAALLPRGKFEFVPSVFYQHQSKSAPGQIALNTQGEILITENILRSTQVQANALLRAGLPWDMQVEVAIPYVSKDTSVVSRVGGSGLSGDGVAVRGFGDPSIALTKQILRETDRRPGLFANLSWGSNLGQVRRNIALGKGFTEWTAGLNAVMRQDPLVFTGGFTYLYSGQNRGFRPGVQYVPSLGVLLAVSPETSLQFNQQFTFSEKDSFNGISIPGSDKTSGIFSIGLLSVLGRGRVISLSVGIGETPDSPDLFFQVALPMRLN